MQQKKIVLINTSMKLLRTEASSVFGRYMIAQILAAYDRGSIPEKERHVALLDVRDGLLQGQRSGRTLLAAREIVARSALSTITVTIGREPDNMIPT